MADKTVENDKLEHTMGGATTRDPMDAGVPMLPGKPTERIGPEDALGPGAKRGDYTDRITTGPPMRTEVIPENERTPDGPIYRLVPADSEVGKVGDIPGKGGVDTKAALDAGPSLAPTTVGESRAMRATHDDGSGRTAEAPAQGAGR